jgi:hypothetical protein
MNFLKKVSLCVFYIEKEHETNVMKYVYGSVAASILLLGLVSIGGYIWYKKSLR